MDHIRERTELKQKKPTKDHIWTCGSCERTELRLVAKDRQRTPNEHGEVVKLLNWEWVAKDRQRLTKDKINKWLTFHRPSRMIHNILQYLLKKN